jgi:hypothetical protein
MTLADHVIQYYLDVSVVFRQDELRARVPIQVY